MKRFLLSLLLSIISLVTFAQNNSGWEWASVSGTASASPGSKVLDIATDNAGNVYTVGTYSSAITIGSFSLTTPTGRDIFLAKYSAAGNIIWLKKHMPPTGYNEVGQVINVDTNGNIYIGGTDDTPSFAGVSFLAKYDSNGNMVWNKFYSLYEVGGINFAGDDNPVIMESNAANKKIHKINKTDGNPIWTANITGAGSNAGTTYQDFTDAAGNSYFTCFTTAAGTLNILGDNYTTTGLTTFIASVDNTGNKRWVQQINNVQLQLGYTVDANGKSYIQLGGGAGGTFQGISTASPLGSRYLELDNSGILTRNLLASPYKGLFRVKSDGIYGYEMEQAAGISYTARFGDYYFRVPGTPNTKALAVVVKYDPSNNDKVVWANSLEITGYANNSGSINAIETSVSNKILIGGAYGTSLKTGATTYTAVGSGFAPTDLYVAQLNESNVAAPKTITWTGNAGNNLWADAANWDSGVPNGSERVVIPTGLVTYPTGITVANVTGKLEIGTGVSVTLPSDFIAPGGIVNNGNVTVTGSGTFVSGFNSGASPLTGNGKIIFNTSSPTGITNVAFTGDLEINKPGALMGVGNCSVAGNLYLTAGKLNIDVFTLSNPNAMVTSSANGYVYGGTIKRAINNSGTYAFPIGATSNYAPVSLTLSNVVGPSFISVYYDFIQSNSGGVEPNITLTAGNAINTVLNKNFWKISADAAITSGTYNVNLEATTYTNGVTDAARFVPLRREYRAAAWTFEGVNGVSTQTGETVSAGVTSNGIIKVYTTGIDKFGEFGVGIATSAVASGTTTATTTWTGTAGDKTWATASNWDNGVPNGLTDVMIPSGIATYPEVFVAADNAKTINIANGAAVKFPAILKVSGAITNNGSITVMGSTAEYFKGFKATNTSTSVSSLLLGNGKLIFTDLGPKGTFLDTITVRNDIEINRTIAFKLSNKTIGSVNILNGIVGGSNVDGVQALLNMANAAASLSNNAPTSFITSHIIRNVNANGTTNFPVGAEKYMPMVVTTNNLTGTQAYNVGIETVSTPPKIIVDGYPVTTFLDYNLTNYRMWDISPIGVATGGTIDLNFEARGYTNGVADVNRYVLLKRQDINYPWVKVENAVITENAGIISISVASMAPIVTKAEFVIGIKGTAVTWNGSVSTNYNTPANWTPAVVPDGNYKTIYTSGSTNYPSSYGLAGMMEIAAGATLTLPQTTGGGVGAIVNTDIVNNGTIIVSGTGTFNGFGTSTPLAGTGKIVFNAAGPAAIGLTQLNNNIEINRPAGMQVTTLSTNGSLILTNGIVTGTSLTMTNPNATVTYGPTAYVVTNSFVRNVNSSGTYQFPIGTAARYSPAVLVLNSAVGPTKITSSFSTTTTGAFSNNFVANGKAVSKILNSGIWTLTPDATMTAGTYNLTLTGTGYSNGSADVTNYVVLKRQASNYVWEYFGTNGTPTESSGTVTATGNGISGFSDFAIGVATGYETKWTGINGDKKWTTAANWDNGVPATVQKAIFDNTGTNFPEIFTGINNTVDKVEVGAGLALRLPVDLNPTNGIVNNGTIQLIGSYFGGFGGVKLPTGTGKLLFTSLGPSTVSISTSNTLNHNVEIDRSTGINFSAKINGNLNLVSGIVTSSNGITLTDPAATLSYTSGVYIAGNLTRAVNSSGVYTFPVGNATTYTPVNLNLNAVVGPTSIMVGLLALPLNPQPNLVVGGKTVNGALNTGIWVIAPNSAITAGSYDIGIEANKYTNGVTEASRYTLIKQSPYGSAWTSDGTIVTSTQVGGTDNSGVVSNGVVNASSTGLTTMTTANYFAIGIFEPTTLPVKLVDFTAKLVGQSVQLNWETASELNNDKFVIERSEDGNHFVQLGEVKGKGTASFYNYRDAAPANGYNYYRLKQIDLDGTVANSEVKTVKFTLAEETVKLYPNPAIDNFTISGTAKAISSVGLVDLFGRTIASTYANHKVEIPNHLPNGIYLVKISYQDGSSDQQKIIVKK